MRKAIAVFAALLALTLLPARAEADYAHTVLIYMIGADLQESGYAAEDLEEMLGADIGADTCVLLLAGGAPEPFAHLPGSGADNIVYRLEGGAFTPVTTLPEGAMSAPETLRGFLDFARAFAPADSTGLIFWDHGYGPLEGFGSDAREDGDRLTLFEIADALEGGERLDYLCFDACLMSAVETADFLAPYADYLIASQETEPAQGWNYAFLANIEPGMDGGDIGTLAIDSCFAQYEEMYADYPDHMPMLSLACVDLRAMEGVDAAMDAFFTQLREGLAGDAYSDIVRARIDCRGVGKFTTSTEYDLVDLRQCAERMAALCPDGAARVQAALGEAVVYSRSNVEGLAGLSVYFPYDNIPLLLGRWGSVGEAVGCSEGYREFLHDYALMWMGERLTEWTSQPIEGELGDYTLALTDEQAENFAWARYVVLKDVGGGNYQYIYTGWDAYVEGTTLHIPYEGIELYVRGEDGEGRLVASRRDEDEAYTYYHAYVMFEEMPGSWLLRLARDKETGEYRCLDCTLDDEEALSTGKRQSIDLYDGHVLESWSLVIESKYDASGDLLPTPEWELTGGYGVRITTSEALRFGERALPEGLEGYAIVVDVYDTFGNAYTSMVTPIGPSLPVKEAGMLNFDCDLTAWNGRLFTYDGLTAHLTGVETYADEYEATLLLHVSVDNDGDVDKELSMTLPTLNGASIPLDYYSYIDVPAGGSAEGTFELSLRDMSFAQMTSPVEAMEIVWLIMDENYDRTWLCTQFACDVPWTPPVQTVPVSSYTVLEGDSYADENLELTLVSLAQLKDGLALQLRARNLTEEYIDLGLDHLTLNGWEFGNEVSRSFAIAPHAERMLEYTIPYYALAYAGEAPQQMRMAFYAMRSRQTRWSMEYDPLFVTEEIQWSLVPKEPLPLANESGVRVSLLPGQPLLGGNDYVCLSLLVENDTQSTIYAMLSNIRVNGQACELLFLQRNVSKGAKILVYHTYNDYDFSELDLAGQTIETITADIEIWNDDTGVLLATIPDVECVYPADAA